MEVVSRFMYDGKLLITIRRFCHGQAAFRLTFIADRCSVSEDDAGCAPFRDVLRAMERIRSTRQTPLELDIRNLDSGTHENSRSCRSSLGATSLESDSQLASFIGGMAAHPASGVSF